MKPLNAWKYPYTLTLKRLASLLLVSSTLLIAACSTPNVKDQLNQPDWQVSGKIGIRESMLRATSSLFQWKQQDDLYVIYVFNTLGQPQFTLQGNEHLAHLEVADGSEATARNAETLLEQLTGWSFPVEATRQWLQGQLQGNETDVSYNAQQQLTGFMMEDWQVELGRYKPVGNNIYPHRVKLKNEKITLTIIIKDYTVSDHANTSPYTASTRQD